MSTDQPRVLTAGGGGKKSPSKNRNRRGRNKGKQAGAASSANDSAAASSSVAGDAAAQHLDFAKKPATTSSKGKKGKATATPKRSVGSSGSTPDSSPNNPQTGSPPEQPMAASAPSSAVMVAGGGTAGARPLAFNDVAGGRRVENRTEGGTGPAGERRQPYRDNDTFHDDDDDDEAALGSANGKQQHIGELGGKGGSKKGVTPDDLYGAPPEDPHGSHTAGDAVDDAPKSKASDLIWLLVCFLGIMGSFVVYGLLLEYTTSGGRKLHELSFLFVTSSLYTVTAACGRYVRQETPTTIPPARFAVLGLTSMGSTFFSVRSLRYVIYPIQVLAKSCKPVPVMIMGAFMGKKYPLKKYINVCLIVAGVGLFMGGGSSKSKKGAADDDDDGLSASSQAFGILLLFISLCFDGGTGAYEDKLMSVHSVGPFDLMYNIQLGKTILAGVGLLVFNQVHLFIQMCQEMGFLLVALGLSGALGQVFIFVTIAKFGALTCSIIGLARKVTTLVASIYFYGHELNGTQFTGLVVAVGSMVMNFWGKKGKKGGGHGGGHGDGGGHGAPAAAPTDEEKQRFLGTEHTETSDNGSSVADIELGSVKKSKTKTIS